MLKTSTSGAAVTTKASSVAPALKLSNIDWVSARMDNHQERLGTAQLGPFVGVD